MKVVTHNVSWEINNADKDGIPRELPTLKKEQRWSRAHNAWVKKDDPWTMCIGPPYSKALAKIIGRDPDIILLQEYQKTSSALGNSLDVFKSYGYAVCAEANTGPAQVPACCLVLARSDWCKTAADVSGFVNWQTFMIGGKYPFKSRGRPVAIAIARGYLIVSSHSSHGIAWHGDALQNTLNHIANSLEGHGVSVPQKLVWGGDFNGYVSFKKCKWRRKPLLMANQRKPTLGKRTTDWILSTEHADEVGLTANGKTHCFETPSDHVAVFTNFIDAAS